MGDLHQMCFGNTIGLRHLRDGAQTLGLLRDIHQQAHRVVAHGSQAHRATPSSGIERVMA